MIIHSSGKGKAELKLKGKVSKGSSVDLAPLYLSSTLSPVPLWTTLEFVWPCSMLIQLTTEEK